MDALEDRGRSPRPHDGYPMDPVLEGDVGPATCNVSASLEAVETAAREASAQALAQLESVGEAALAESTLALEAGARRLAALDTRLRASWGTAAGAAAGGVAGGPFAGQMAALQSADAWLPSALAGMALPSAAARSSEGADGAAAGAAGGSGSDGDQAATAADSADVAELSSALALTQQLLARQREETRHYKDEAAQLRAAAAASAARDAALSGAGGSTIVLPRSFAAQQQQREAEAAALRDELQRTREALALVTAERDALRLKLCTPSAAGSAAAGPSPVSLPLRAAAAELAAASASRNASDVIKSGASVRSGEDGASVLSSSHPAAGEAPSAESALASLSDLLGAAITPTKVGSPRRKSGAPDAADGPASRLLARLVQGMSGEKDGSRSAE